MLYNNNNKLSIALSICSLDSNNDIIWVYSNDDSYTINSGIGTNKQDI